MMSLIGLANSRHIQTNDFLRPYFTYPGDFSFFILVNSIAGRRDQRFLRFLFGEPLFSGAHW